MGLLDDAIREHLELKRRRGADPSEVDRLEHEALGPVRREPFEPANQKGAADAELDDRSVAVERPSEPTDADYEEYYEEEYYEETEPDEWGEPFAEDFERSSSRARRHEPASAEEDREPAEPPTEHEPGRGFLRWRRSRKASVPPEEAPPTQAEPPAEPPDEDETGEYGVEDALPGRGGMPEEGPSDDAPPEDEADVLEETPEFLQDAPEHDRLWFEQRPPRDFDFDD